MKVITSIALIIAAVFAGVDCQAQRFEGSIGFTKNIGPVTAKYIYHVKGDKVRVEELDELGEIQGIMIVNTTDNTVVALSPERKMYIDVPNRRKTNKADTQVSATGKTKSLNGYTCEEWTVKSPEDGREVSYWIATGEFDFFLPMLQTLNRKDKMALYYMDVPGAENGFPMEGVEAKTDGMELTKLSVDQVSNKALSADLFEIPNDYTKFERETSQ